MAIEDGMEDFDDASYEGNLFLGNAQKQSSVWANQQNAMPVSDLSKSNTSQ